MKLKRIALVAGITALGLSAASAQEIDCERVGAQVQTQSQNAPEQVLVLVEDAIIANEMCACEIVKGAIVGSKADKRLVREIVFTAVSAAQGMAATIAECAIAVAPDSADQIKLALEDALVGSNGKAPAYAGGSNGKAPVGGYDQYAQNGGKSPVGGYNSYGQNGNNQNGNNGQYASNSKGPGVGQGPQRLTEGGEEGFGVGFGGIPSSGIYVIPPSVGGVRSAGSAQTPVIEVTGEREVVREVIREVPGPVQVITQPPVIITQPPVFIPVPTSSSASLVQ